MSFNTLINEIKAKYERLVRAKPFLLKTFPKNLPRKGIYYMQEKGQPMYIGRSNFIRRRLRNHTRPRHNQASFAFLMARAATGQHKAAYSIEGSRSQLLQVPKFKKRFHQSLGRVLNMQVRVVEEEDQMKQALLEIYASYMLKTPFNHFDTH